MPEHVGGGLAPVKPSLFLDPVASQNVELPANVLVSFSEKGGQSILQLVNVPQKGGSIRLLKETLSIDGHGESWDSIPAKTLARFTLTDAFLLIALKDKGLEVRNKDAVLLHLSKEGEARSFKNILDDGTGNTAIAGKLSVKNGIDVGGYVLTKTNRWFLRTPQPFSTTSTTPIPVIMSLDGAQASLIQFPIRFSGRVRIFVNIRAWNNTIGAGLKITLMDEKGELDSASFVQESVAINAYPVVLCYDSGSEPMPIGSIQTFSLTAQTIMPSRGGKSAGMGYINVDAFDIEEF